MNGTLELRGLIVGWDEKICVPSDFSAAEWEIFEMDVRKTLTPVVGYTPTAISPADVILTTPKPWTSGEEGYNFAHMPPNRTAIPFSKIGSIYRIHYTLTPTNSALPLIVIPFEIEVI
jgi:hypothetical protein